MAEARRTHDLLETNRLLPLQRLNGARRTRAVTIIKVPLLPVLLEVASGPAERVVAAEVESADRCLMSSDQSLNYMASCLTIRREKHLLYNFGFCET